MYCEHCTASRHLAACYAAIISSHLCQMALSTSCNTLQALIRRLDQPRTTLRVWLVHPGAFSAAHRPLKEVMERDGQRLKDRQVLSSGSLLLAQQVAYLYFLQHPHRLFCSCLVNCRASPSHCAVVGLDDSSRREARALPLAPTKHSGQQLGQMWFGLVLPLCVSCTGWHAEGSRPSSHTLWPPRCLCQELQRVVNSPSACGQKVSCAEVSACAS